LEGRFVLNCALVHDFLVIPTCDRHLRELCLMDAVLTYTVID